MTKEQFWEIFSWVLSAIVLVTIVVGTYGHYRSWW